MEHRKLKVLHLIPTLGQGGAEKLLLSLIAKSENTVHEVITLQAYQSPFDLSHIQHTDLNLTSKRQLLLALPALRKLIREKNPDVIHSWMYHANLLSRFLVTRNTPIIWSIHASNLPKSHCKRSTRWINRLGSFLSYCIPDKIVYCSFAAKHIHERSFYNRAKSHVIENAIDTQQFHRNTSYRYCMREELGIDNKQFLLGHVGRFDPQKDHQTLLHAVSLAREKKSQLCLLLCGHGITSRNTQLVEWIKQYQLADICYLLPARNDMPHVMNSLDGLVVSSAYGESMPLVMLEAMACGVPVVSTDVGACSTMLGQFATIVPPSNAHALAEAIAMLSFSSELQAKARRAYVLENFQFARMQRHYHELYYRVASQYHELAPIKETL